MNSTIYQKYILFNNKTIKNIGLSMQINSFKSLSISNIFSISKFDKVYTLLQKNKFKYIVHVLLLAILIGLITYTVLNTIYGNKQLPLTVLESNQNNFINTVAPPVFNVPTWLSTASNLPDIPWKLIGTVSAGKFSYALLKKNEDRAFLVPVGKQLPDGTTLLKVSHKQATLLHNSTEISLILPTEHSNTTAINEGNPHENQPSNYENRMNNFEQEAIVQAQMESEQIKQLEKLKQESERQNLARQSIQANIQSVQNAAIQAAKSAANISSLAPINPVE